MVEPVIRLARPNELKTVQDLNHDLFLSDQEHLHDLNVEWPYTEDGENYFRDLIAGGRGVCFVAELDGVAVGYLAGGKQKPHNGYIGKRAELENMFMRGEVRSKGVGGKLVDAFFAWCKEQGMDYVMVTAFSPNTRAIAFYEKQGFEKYAQTLWKKLDG